MSQYTLICILFYLLSHCLLCVTSYTTVVTCSFVPKDHLHNRFTSNRYKCPGDCSQTHMNPPDLTKVELNYRICSHPDLQGDGAFTIKSIDKDKEHAWVQPLGHRLSRRALSLTPAWQSEPQSVSVNQADKVELGCSIAALQHTPQTIWLYSESYPSSVGDTLSSTYTGAGGTTDTSGTLFIQSASSQDAGYYQCKVIDMTQDGNHVVYSDIVKVEINNFYLKSPSGGMLKENKVEGQATHIVIFECPSVESNPPAVITWFKDGVEIDGMAAALVYPFSTEQELSYNSETYQIKANSLLLLSVTSALDGKYKCRATNSKINQIADIKEFTLRSLSTSDSSLENAKPTVLYERSYTVDKGATVELYCLGVGHPTAMTYTWTYDNKALEYSDRVVRGDLGRKITITDVTLNDIGTYKCSCLNNIDDTDVYMTLKVQEPETIPELTITSAPTGLYVHDVYSTNPNDIFVPCEATGADQVRFLKNGELLAQSSRYTFGSTGLTFTEYSSEDSGVYQCVAYNAGHWKQKMTFVMITEKVTASAVANVAHTNTVATLSCTVTGYPYPDVTWTRNGQPITNKAATHSPYVISNAPNHQLIITDISFDDSGEYECSAESTALNYNPSYSHSASSTVTLTIGDLNPDKLKPQNGGHSVRSSVLCVGTYVILTLLLSIR